jgi:hypothetical protein
MRFKPSFICCEHSPNWSNMVYQTTSFFCGPASFALSIVSLFLSVNVQNKVWVHWGSLVYTDTF